MARRRRGLGPGNGVPDLIDELLVELRWLTKMQPDDLEGGALLKMGNIEHGDPVPEESTFKRYYYPEPCSSATACIGPAGASFPPRAARGGRVISAGTSCSLASSQ